MDIIIVPIMTALEAINSALAAIGIPYSFGFAIIIFTLLIKLLTAPLNARQIKSSKAMQELQPQLKELQKKYKDDKEALAQKQMDLYKEAGVNPLGGCLPTLIQFPIWIGLYQSLFRLANAGKLAEGFFWIPSLSEPTGMGWIWPLAGDKLVAGWPYLVLPVLTIVTQVLLQKMMTPRNQDPQAASMGRMMMFMPLMFGFFAIQVPSGLALYWVTMNIFSMIQQYLTVGWGSLLPEKEEPPQKKSRQQAQEKAAKPASSQKKGKATRGRKKKR